jgi:chromosome segregation ATPase
MTRRLRQGAILVWVVALVLVGAAGGFMLSRQAKEFSSHMAKVEEEKRQLDQARQELQGRLGSLATDRDTVTQERELLAIDRNNLLDQAKRLLQEKNDLLTVTELHERVLKQTADENRALKGQLKPMEQELRELQVSHAQLRQEHEAAQAELTRLSAADQSKPLKDELEREKAKREEIQKLVQMLELRNAKTQAALPKLQEKLDKLTERHTKIMADNKALRFGSKHVPDAVSGLAREHEQLLQEVADTHYNLGVLFAKNEDYTRAAKEFEKVVQLKPDDGDAYYNLGLIYAEHVPDRDKATAAFKRYLEINPRAGDASWVKQYIVSWRAWDAEERVE